jgi:hypothetical protein
MTSGISAAHPKIMGGADETGRTDSMFNMPRLGELVSEDDDIDGRFPKMWREIVLSGQRIIV